MLVINDLTVSQELDRDAMAAVSGGNWKEMINAYGGKKQPKKYGWGHVPFIAQYSTEVETVNETSLSLDYHNFSGHRASENVTLIYGL